MDLPLGPSKIRRSRSPVRDDEKKNTILTDEELLLMLESDENCLLSRENFLVIRMMIIRQAIYTKAREMTPLNRLYKIQPLINYLKLKKSDGFHLSNKVLKYERKRYLYERCKICYERGIRKDTIYYCEQCKDQPGLCLDKCSQEHHEEFQIDLIYSILYTS